MIGWLAVQTSLASGSVHGKCRLVVCEVADTCRSLPESSRIISCPGVEIHAPVPKTR